MPMLIHACIWTLLCLFLIGFTTDGGHVCQWSSVTVLWACIGNMCCVDYHASCDMCRASHDLCRVSHDITCVVL